MASRAWRTSGERLVVAVRLTPKAAFNRIEGITELVDGRAALQARVRAAPEMGKANSKGFWYNAALEALLAKALGVPKSAVSVIAGKTSRIKSVRVAGRPKFLTAAFNKIC